MVSDSVQQSLEQLSPAMTGRASELRADEIRWDLTPAPWLSSARVLSVAVMVLPTVEDDIAADVIEQQALALVDRDEELTSLRAVLAVALDLAHASQAERMRLRRTVAELRQARREGSA